MPRIGGRAGFSDWADRADLSDVWFGGERAGQWQLLAVATALDELLLQGGNLAVEEVIGLVDEADEGVSPDGWVGVVEPPGVKSRALGV